MERNRKKKPALLLIIIGVVLIVFGIDGIIMTIGIITKAESVSDEFLRIGKDVILIIVIFGAAVFLLLEAKKITEVDKMMEHGMNNAEEISKSTRISYGKTCKIINKLINKGVYTDVIFDPARKEIIRITQNNFRQQ